MKRITSGAYIAGILFLSLFNNCIAQGQTISLNDTDKKTFLTNLSKIITAVKTDFATLKKGESYLNGNNTLSWQSATVLFPAYTSNENYLLYFHTYNGKSMPTYTEKIPVDIYNILDVITPLLKSKGFVEVDPRGLFTDWAGKCFRSNETVVQLATDTKAAKANTTIDIGKFHYYYEKNSIVEKSNKLGQPTQGNNPEPIAKNNLTPGAKKSFGFTYYTNASDTTVVKKVYPESQAFIAGLKEGDFIQKINNVAIVNKTLSELTDMLLKAETIKLVVIRNSKPVSLTITKDYAYKFDRTCLSGDCINGTGVSLSRLVEGQMLEGVFKDGELIDGNWYVKAKSLQQKGIRVRMGKMVDGKFFTGNIYDGTKPNGGWWYQVKNHDLQKFNRITSENFNGEVKCYTNDNINRYIWEGEFVDGRKEGFFHEYLYDKNFEWSYKISNGVMSNQRLRYLGDDKNIPGSVGSYLTYDSISKTWSGKFTTQDCCYEELVNVSSFSDLKNKYDYVKNSSPGNSNVVNNRPVKVNNTDNTEMMKDFEQLSIWLKEHEAKGLSDIENCRKCWLAGMAIARVCGECKRALDYCGTVTDKCYTFLKKHKKFSNSEAVKLVKERYSTVFKIGYMLRTGVEYVGEVDMNF